MKKKNKLSKLVPVILMYCFLLCVGALLGVYLVQFGGIEDHGFLVFLLQIYLGIFAGYLIQIPVHEAGHLVFGLLSGYGFSSYRIGNLMWLKENGKIRFCRFSLAGTGGQCLMVPPEPVDGKYPTVLYHLGGCLMNLIVSVLFLVLAFALQGGLAGMVFFLIGAVGILLAIVNGVPMNNGLANDGYNAMSLRKDPAAMKAMWLQLKISEQTSRGIRLKDMPEEWFEMPPDEVLENVLVSAVGVFHCNRLLDQGRIEEADEKMRKLMGLEKGLLEVYRNMLVCDRICCCLLLGREDDILNRMGEKDYVKFRKSMKTMPSVYRTEYMFALLRERDMEKAEKALNAFEKCAAKYPYPSEIESERELMQLARAKGEATV